MMKLSVSGITCGGCAAAIERAIGATLPGTKVEVDVMKGTVAVNTQPAHRQQVKAAIEDAGFAVTGEAA
ncbi:MAG TPA: heavy-metal-associated domain-containing protein [Dongiaceae bacterium]|nr:heavy-metal-associated domain-containing protein [Dongiaceae bacterium]